MNELNSIPAISKVNHYADLRSNTVKASSLHSIPASSLYKHSGMSALGNYNQASVSFEGFGFFQKLADKIKDKKAKHDEKKAEKLQAKAEKKAAALKSGPAVSQSATVTPEETKATAKEEVKTEAVKAAAEEPAVAEESAKVEEAVKAEEAPKAEETKPAPQKRYDLGFHEENSQMKYFKVEDPQTGDVTITWYNLDGSIRWVQRKEFGGQESYMNFYDKDGQMPKEEFITLEDGKHEYIRYRKNGLMNSLTQLEEDNKTIIYLTRYHYKENTRKLESLRTNYADGTSVTEWYKDNGDVEVRQFAKDKKVTKTLWYFEDGEKVRTMHTPLENGGLERTTYAEDGRILLSDRTKPDKSTTDEITNYFYDDCNSLSETITTTSNDETIKTWYGENEVPTCTKFAEHGRETKTVWYFADGEKPKLEELYLEDGRKQVVNFDESERWLNFKEYETNDAKEPSKSTQYFYKGDSEVPHYSITTYANGKKEKCWFDGEENMTCRQTEESDKIVKLEWFHENGITPKIVRSFADDGTFTDQKFDKDGKVEAA